MAVQNISYTNKVALNQNAGISDTNKVNASDMNEIKTVVNNNATEISTNTTNIANITGQILWTNPNPTSNFVAQTITLSSSDYDMYEVLFLTNLADQAPRLNSTGKLLKGYGSRLSASFADSANPGANVYSRWITYISDTQIEFATGYVAYGSTARTENTALIVPLYVIGYKTGLFN